MNSRTRLGLNTLILGTALTVHSTALGQMVEVLFGIDRDFATIDSIEPTTGTGYLITTLNFGEETVNSGNGLAVNPVTNEVYVAVKLESQSGPGRNLFRVDPVSGHTTDIGNMGQPIAGLAFDDEGTLYGVSGDCLRGCGGQAIAETLFTVDLTDASLTQFQALGNGDDGEALAFNPADGLMYHMSGIGAGLIFESINLDTGVVTPIPLSGDPIGPHEAVGFTYDATRRHFVGAIYDWAGATAIWFTLTADGVFTNNGPPEYGWKDYAFWKTRIAGAPAGDVNTSQNTDIGVLMRDTVAERNKYYVMDGGTGELATTVTFGPELTVDGFANVPDATADQVPEPAVLVQGSRFARVKNGVDGSLIGRPPFDPSLAPVEFLAAGDVNGDSSQDVAFVGENLTTGSVQVQIKDSATGALVSRVNFDRRYGPFGAVVVDNVAGSAANEIAVFGIDSEGRIRAQIKDASTGQLVSLVYFDRNYYPIAYFALPDTTGANTYVGVLGRSADNVLRAQIKRAVDGSLVNLLRFDSSLAQTGVAVFPDSNGSGGGELAVIGYLGNNSIRAQIKEIEDGSLVGIVPYSSTYAPVLPVAVNGVGGTGSNELALLGRSRETGEYRWQIKDVATGAQITNIPVP